eukprot:CAMPEP_0175059562 /NCGR_PEP_ID=MMETSP0052_2-20121109/12501_1 /TAXON_ID=51329 ORGANISM="Polytomella parva, Strain SAG 63-3" /NCGR_SAMPLE_ID=MMETSP0052_2 /ASSEMBLY_ACC=CAM_ASM_000194 /LENGTH=807 /DNA_ID=CAMNT_0016325125 /DNA_START=33 /DNA_END=2453 /DNA_ORIENTATION=-
MSSADRKLYPIIDALEARNWKLAHRLASTALQKNPKHDLLMAYHAFASHRLGKIDEANKLCDAILDSDPTTEPLLTVLGLTLAALNRGSDMARAIENAANCNPQDKDLQIKLFNTYVKSFDFVKQQQLSLRLSKSATSAKTQRQYCWWVIMSLLLQARQRIKVQIHDLMSEIRVLQEEAIRSGSGGKEKGAASSHEGDDVRVLADRIDLLSLPLPSSSDSERERGVRRSGSGSGSGLDPMKLLQLGESMIERQVKACGGALSNSEELLVFLDVLLAQGKTEKALEVFRHEIDVSNTVTNDEKSGKDRRSESTNDNSNSISPPMTTFPTSIRTTLPGLLREESLWLHASLLALASSSPSSSDVSKSRIQLLEEAKEVLKTLLREGPDNWGALQAFISVASLSNHLCSHREKVEAEGKGGEEGEKKEETLEKETSVKGAKRLYDITGCPMVFLKGGLAELTRASSELVSVRGALIRRLLPSTRQQNESARIPSDTTLSKFEFESGSKLECGISAISTAALPFHLPLEISDSAAQEIAAFLKELDPNLNSGDVSHDGKDISNSPTKKPTVTRGVALASVELAFRRWFRGKVASNSNGASSQDTVSVHVLVDAMVSYFKLYGGFVSCAADLRVFVRSLDDEAGRLLLEVLAREVERDGLLESRSVEGADGEKDVSYVVFSGEARASPPAASSNKADQLVTRRLVAVLQIRDDLGIATHLHSDPSRLSSPAALSAAAVAEAARLMRIFKFLTPLYDGLDERERGPADELPVLASNALLLAARIQLMESGRVRQETSRVGGDSSRDGHEKDGD